MKCFVVIVIILVLVLNIFGLKLFPNVKLTLKTLSGIGSMQYLIEPLAGSFSPLHPSGSYSISLESILFENHQELYWMLNFKHTNKNNCNWSFQLTVEEVPEKQDGSFVEFESWRDKKHKVVKFLHDNKKIPLVMDFYGCIKSNRFDQMHNNEINLILFEYNKPSEITAWNATFIIHQSLLGYLQIKNVANANNTDEKNEQIFRDLIIYCMDVQNIKGYIPSFDGLYEKNASKIPNELTFVSIIVVAILFLCLITCSYFCYTLD